MKRKRVYFINTQMLINRKIFFLLMVGFLVQNHLTMGQNIASEAKLDSTSVLIGDQVKLHLKVNLPAKYNLHWPNIGDTIIRNLLVLGRTKIDSVWSADKKELVLSQDLLLTSFDSGFYTIPPIRFFYSAPPDTVKSFSQTRLIFLSVNTVKVDTTQAIKPIKGPIKVPWTMKEILKWILMGALAVCILGLIVYVIGKRKRSQPVFSLKTKVHQLPPHEVALNALEALRLKKLWQAGRMKEYYTELTEILRVYLEERYLIKALESTTTEIIQSLKAGLEIPAELLTRLNTMLVLADMVKFAKERPLPDENESVLANAMEFIRSTIVVIPMKESDTSAEKAETNGKMSDDQRN
jgi:hypothetical protein